jgi:excisionase family DNA binding protein
VTITSPPMPIPSTSPTPLYESIGYVAAIYGISRSTIVRSLAAGHFEAVRMGGRVLVSLTSVERFFASLPRTYPHSSKTT